MSTGGGALFIGTRKVVLISGAPGSGKTTLALPLAARLVWPLITKDHIKQTLFDSMGGTPGDQQESRRFGAGAMETLWTLAALSPAVILEANFRPQSSYERERIRGLGGQVVEVHCRCPRDVTISRFRSRGAAGVHPAHPWWLMTDEAFAEFEGPIGVGPVIEIDTTRAVDCDELAERILGSFES